MFYFLILANILIFYCYNVVFHKYFAHILGTFNDKLRYSHEILSATIVTQFLSGVKTKNCENELRQISARLIFTAFNHIYFDLRIFTRRMARNSMSSAPAPAIR